MNDLGCASKPGMLSGKGKAARMHNMRAGWVGGAKRCAAEWAPRLYLRRDAR
jgi:hypothetical protein